jgi:AAHS family 4-hydroxybenzoate transporter-like MFS transporter
MWASLVTMYTLTAGAFPAAVRSSGLGLALGAGRIGSVLGPYAGGLVLAGGASVGTTCLLLAIPALAAAILMALTRSDAQAYDASAVGFAPDPLTAASMPASVPQP